MKKKFLAVLCVLVMLAATLAGCGGNNGSSDSDSSEGDSGSGDGSANVTIWYYWETAGHQDTLNKVVSDFNETQDEYVVEAKYVPFADFKKQLSIGASADELPDLVILDNPDHAAYADMGIFADITGKFDVSTYYDGPVASCTLDDKLYGVPFGSNCLLLFYNEDMLDEAGVDIPTTWDELLAAADACTDASNNVSGFAHCALQNEEGTFNFLPWIWSTGATSYEIDSEGGLKALNFVHELTDSGAMTKEAINWTQGDTMNQFISGNLAMMINGTWQVPTMREEVPELNWNVAQIPTDANHTSGLGGENFAVINGGNEDGAIKFLEYATSKDVSLYMMEAMGYISPNSELAEGQFDGDPVYEEFVEAMNYAQARGPLAQWPDISDAISLAFNEVITGASDAETAAAKAQETIDGIMAGISAQ